MKLSKALKEKNRLAGEVARLKTIIQRENSRDTKSTSTVDVAATWTKFQEATEALILIKFTFDLTLQLYKYLKVEPKSKVKHKIQAEM